MADQIILLAEDDTDLGNILSQYLEMQGYKVLLARDGQTAWEMFQDNDVQICVLDVMMPMMDGYEVAEKINRKSPETPFLFLTAKSLKEDRIKGLKLGADDYIAKPFDVDELVLRIQNILRRTGSPEVMSFQIGQYDFSFEELVLKGPEDSHKLTMKEGMLLRFFLQHQNKLVKREDILEELWGENDYFLGRSMDVFVSRLRKYLSNEKSVAIDTVRGTGYIFRRK
ncbi:MAG: response regulator transcription factor [Bacteroidetes bacterium]|jgi:DNA-binding response OmpR family regulator|nr:response regulator transcription factor [Bacteroidota bacterium]MBT3749070.1 response regulator transcription factor [Bacteroidota bacterium]MBT4400948.1 response regulator transcription factor [Bacteroidota bacterium]MBT4408948.1 response regulator transcription factor [Bacteroidota bacterium]MBT7465112.1 response regulator transcription factor [Bacteroidota bacterium]